MVSPNSKGDSVAVGQDVTRAVVRAAVRVVMTAALPTATENVDRLEHDKGGTTQMDNSWTMKVTWIDRGQYGMKTNQTNVSMGTWEVTIRYRRKKTQTSSGDETAMDAAYEAIWKELWAIAPTAHAYKIESGTDSDFEYVGVMLEQVIVFSIVSASRHHS